jgi:aspartyl protease family protein
MGSDNTAQALYAIIVIVLVASSFFARRIPLRQTFKMLLAWLAIFGVAIILFSFRQEAKFVWERVKSEISPSSIIDNNGSVRIPKSEDGHFWADATLNGKPVRLLVDSGATITSLSLETARSANVDVSGSGFPVFIETANGTVKAQRATVASFNIGPIERKEFSITVSESFGDTNVVGMNFLSTLDSWRVEGDELLLNPNNKKQTE